MRLGVQIRFIKLTREAAEAEGPQPLISVGVIQDSNCILGVVQLAASYDSKVVQRD